MRHGTESRDTQSFAKFDAHMHVVGPKTPFVRLMDVANICSVLNISFGDFGAPNEIAQYEEGLRVDTERFPGRFFYCASFNITQFREPNYARDVVEKLTRDIDEFGAVAVKVWKDLGMMLRDEGGAYVFCDDARFAPVFDFLAERNMPIVMHTADPKAAWESLDPESPHYGYYMDHPEFHWHGRADVPTHKEILAHRDALLRRYPDTTFVCAHLASLEHDVDAVAAFLDTFPNAVVDASSRVKDLKIQPVEKVLALFSDHSDRILFGSDWDVDEGSFSPDAPNQAQEIAECARRLDADFAFFEKTLVLNDVVLESFYMRNAKRVFGLEGGGH